MVKIDLDKDRHYDLYIIFRIESIKVQSYQFMWPTLLQLGQNPLILFVLTSVS